VRSRFCEEHDETLLQSSRRDTKIVNVVRIVADEHRGDELLDANQAAPHQLDQRMGRDVLHDRIGLISRTAPRREEKCRPS
jgi:hypothetical protein